MHYNVTLAKNAKVNGKHLKVGEVAENVSESLLEELQTKELVANFEEAKQEAKEEEEVKPKRQTKQTAQTENAE
ncbi:hypothetical protein D0439_10160 [Lysinibacillus fusiformis]|uniref:hypothetical protein n=1 Tax=Lysinibacillus fusiformis TaxID=28031 RepID=UPI0011BBD954|nr:hypothetical protein [Lysinibacillus fusiformis]QDZ98974.1 hypothetical protein D0439_10160 [Lysinibacillus fusiformis]